MLAIFTRVNINIAIKSSAAQARALAHMPWT
jgi:hypothetical protein